MLFIARRVCKNKDETIPIGANGISPNPAHELGETAHGRYDRVFRWPKPSSRRARLTNGRARKDFCPARVVDASELAAIVANVVSDYLK
jgi:hypothetical protein